MIGSILRYKGSKWNVRRTLMAFRPTEYDWYAEPFLGGGAILFEQPEIPRFANDLNWDVFNFWSAVKRAPDFISRFVALREKSMQVDISTLKKMFEQAKHDLVFHNDPLAFLYLNRFAHQHLVLRKRKDIASFDDTYRRCGIRPVTPQKLLSAQGLLQGVELFNLDFGNFFSQLENAAGQGWLFIDPPYWLDDHGSSFYLPFDADDHQRLRDWMAKTKHFVSLTVGDDCKTHRLYMTMPGFNSLPMFYRYQKKMDSHAKRPLKREWLIRNFGDSE